MTDFAKATETAMIEVLHEYNRACELHGDFHSTHEGYAVILEELDELWDAIKSNSDRDAARAEACQVAAMAMRFMVDLC